MCCGFHAEVTGKSAEEASGQECHRHPVVLESETVCHDGKQNYKYEEYKPYNLVLLTKIRHRSLTHIRGYFAHGVGAFTLAHHTPVKVPCHAKSEQRCGRYNPK